MATDTVTSTNTPKMYVVPEEENIFVAEDEGADYAEEEARAPVAKEVVAQTPVEG